MRGEPSVDAGQLGPEAPEARELRGIAALEDGPLPPALRERVRARGASPRGEEWGR
jgi:hypothetical protein